MVQDILQNAAEESKGKKPQAHLSVRANRKKAVLEI